MLKSFFQHGRHAFYSDALVTGASFRPPFEGRAYPCLLWDHRGDWPADAQAQLAKSLIESNCRYVVCGGLQSEVWHDQVDEAFVLHYLEASEEDRDSHHVMTSLHQTDSVEDVAFFFALNTNFDEHDFAEFLVLHLGGTPAQQLLVEESVRDAEIGEAAG